MRAKSWWLLIGLTLVAMLIASLPALAQKGDETPEPGVEPVKPTVEAPIQPIQPIVPTVEVPIQPTAEIPTEPTIEIPVEPIQPIEPTIEPIQPIEPTIEPIQPIEPTTDAPIQPLQPTIEVPVEPTMLPTTVMPDGMFIDDFQDGEASGWTLSAGWRIGEENGNHFLETGSSGEVAVINGIAWPNFYLSARWSVSLQSTISVTFRSQPENYTAVLFSNERVELYRGETMVAENTASAPESQEMEPVRAWRQVEIQALGNTITVTTNGIAQISFVDSNPVLGGPISFKALPIDSDAVTLDEVALIRLDESVAPVTPETPSATPESTPTPVVQETQMTKPGIPGLSTDLYELYELHQTGAPIRTPTTAGLEIQGNRVRVMFVMLDVGSANNALALISGLGGDIVTNFETWIGAWIPIDRLPEAAELPGVSLLRSAIPVKPIDDAGPEPPFINDPTPRPLSANTTTNLGTPVEIPGGGHTTQAVSAYFNSILRDGCVITSTFTVGDAGRYSLQIWDDQEKIYEQFFSAYRGQRFTHRYQIVRPVGQVAPGYGLAVVGPTGQFLALNDPYAIPTFVSRICGNQVHTQGVGPSNAQTWHKQGLIGAGVRVGVIDTFCGYQAARNQGELPTGILTLGTLDLDSSDPLCPHGTAVAEIIYDMAPGVTFVFTSPRHLDEMVAAIRTMSDQSASNPYRVDIISSSVGIELQAPGDGRGVFANAVSEANERGVLYVQAAGNSRKSNWQGAFRDTNGNGLHEFAPGVEINQLKNVPTPGDIMLCLRWNSWPTTDQDYNLYLYRLENGNWMAVSRSDIAQSGGEPPVEYIHYTVTTPGRYGFAIYNDSATGSHILDVYGCQSPDFSVNRTERSLIDAATPLRAFSVAAVRWWSVKARHESYSSEGPTLGEGGSLDEATDFDQPRISGFAVVKTWTWPVFDGTSAATPHVAGAAALVRGAFGYSAGEIATFLEQLAKNLGPRGYDTKFGAGRLYLGPPPSRLSAPRLVTPKGGLSTTDHTQTFGWDLDFQADHYEIQIARDYNFRNVVAVASTTATSYTRTLSTGSYYWRVRCIRNDVESKWSQKRSLRIRDS